MRHEAFNWKHEHLLQHLDTQSPRVYRILGSGIRCSLSAARSRHLFDLAASVLEQYG